MKKLVIRFVIGALALVNGTNIFAQQQEQSSRHQEDSTNHIRTLIHFSRPKYVGFYVAPEFQYGQMKGEMTPFAGASAMLLFNKQWGIGITGQHSLDRNFSPSGVAPLYLQGGYGGLKLEYTSNPNAPIHFAFPLVVGMGTARADSSLFRNRYDHDMYQQGNHNKNNAFDNNHYFLIQPGIEVEANLFRFVKLFAGANYRLAFDSNSKSTTSTTTNVALPASTLNGFSANIGLKIGIFDKSIGERHRWGGRRGFRHGEEKIER